MVPELLIWLGFIGCTSSPSPETPTDPSVVDSGPVDTGYFDDTGSTLLERFTIVEEGTSDDGYGWVDYQVNSYAVAEILAPDGMPARFHVLQPISPTQSHPVLLDLHGGSLDVDDAENPKGAYERCTSEYTAEKITDRLQKSRLTHVLASQGWVVVLPENPFCDGWVGMGPDDPVDPTHAGFLMAELAVAFVKQNIPTAGLSVSGTSLGALGVAWFANHTEHPIQTLMVDSGATDAVRYYAEEDYSPIEPDEAQGRFEHILGGGPYNEDGQPSAFYDRYVDLSILRSVSESGLRIPVLHSWNSYDAGSPSIQHEDLAKVLVNHYDKDGIRWAEYPLHHRSPGHPQLHASTVPYLVWAALQFAEGRDLQIIEAELAAGTLGDVWMDEPDVWTASGNGVRRVGTVEGSGQLLTVDIVVPAGEITVTPFLSIGPGGTPDQPVATLQLRHEDAVVAEQTFTVADLTPADGDMDAMVLALVQTTLSAKTTGGAVNMSIDVLGTVDVDADVLVVTHPNL